MSLEQRLRDTLEETGRSLKVPAPRRVPATRPAVSWRRRSAFAVTGATAALILVVVPTLLLGPEDIASTDPLSGPTEITAPEATSTAVTGSSTTTIVEPETLPVTPGVIPIAETRTDRFQFTVVAQAEGDEAPEPATLTLRLSDLSGRVLDEVVVGEPSGFFWNVVTGPGGVCGVVVGDDDQEVVLQVLLSPSLGCSDPYVFAVDGKGLEQSVPSPVDVALLFVGTWEVGTDLALVGLADPEAVEQALAITRPARLVWVGCEGAAGSVFCTWEAGDDGSRLVVRVSNADQPVVSEVARVDGP